MLWNSAQTEDAPPYVSAGSDLAAYLRSNGGSAQDAKLSNLQEIMLLNGITEAIANCARHSGASHVKVSMDQDESWLNIAVYDDGRGFDTSGMLARNRNVGVGLRYMRACAESINAEFWVGSVEGAGTTIRFSIPSSAIRGPWSRGRR